jgi:hypothetical protein
MKKTFLLIMLFGFFFQAAKPVPADNSAVKGSWKCAVMDVPYEYTNSIVRFTEKEGKLGGSVKFDSGEEIKLNTVKYTNNQLTITLFVEGYSITVDGKVSDSKITGTVDTPDGKVNFTASRVVEKKK